MPNGSPPVPLLPDTERSDIQEIEQPLSSNFFEKHVYKLYTRHSPTPFFPIIRHDENPVCGGKLLPVFPLLLPFFFFFFFRKPISFRSPFRTVLSSPRVSLLARLPGRAPFETLPLPFCTLLFPQLFRSLKIFLYLAASCLHMHCLEEMIETVEWFAAPLLILGYIYIYGFLVHVKYFSKSEREKEDFIWTRANAATLLNHFREPDISHRFLFFI